jgi:hypothetical protein
LVWAWSALAVVALLVVAYVVVNATRLKGEDVQQAAADVAFAERDYEREHGHYTPYLDNLDVQLDSRISVRINADADDFCIEARGRSGHNQYLWMTTEDAFTSNGTVNLWIWPCGLNWQEVEKQFAQ